MTILSRPEWQAAEARHAARFSAVVSQHRNRRSRGEKHPVYDFLFEYYSFRPAHLERWSPGYGVMLGGGYARDRNWTESEAGAGLDINAFPAHRMKSVAEVLQLLKATAERPAQLGCYGIHEWAMVYEAEHIRHPIPLRLSHPEIAATVNELGVRCSHFDAYRFFTEAARPLNVLQPTRELAVELEQPGCIHANMDLYKWSYKHWPWIPSELVGDAFELAFAAREIDMRASPYDLEALGFSPIRIETAQGRADYQEAQAALSRRAEPIRVRLIAAYQMLQDALTARP